MGINREKVYIYGKHAVTEAVLNTPHIIQKVFLEHRALPKEIMQKLQTLQIKVLPFSKQGGVAKDAVHQGAIALIDPSKLVISMEKFLDTVKLSPKTSVVVMDELNDPHNVGAIIRTAAAFGASAVIMPVRNQASLSGTVVKVSVGMVFRVPLVRVDDIPEALRALKHKGFSIYGLAMEGAKVLGSVEFDKPSAFIVGNEGRGIGQAKRALCDTLLSIPMHPRTESLNAAASATAVLYEWSSQHPEALS
jgi:23S rRNA (guanosine2251-2'-O)-methyltransferase